MESMEASGSHIEEGMGEKKPKVMVLTGATAVGKTALSIVLAKKLNAEVISADSVQVYRGLDIGSDKVKAMLCENVFDMRLVS